MPFKSEAQRKWMYANHPEMAKEWSEHTPKGTKLPEHVKHKKADMNTEQAYINGFVKRANAYGFSDNEALELYKLAWSMEGIGGGVGRVLGGLAGGVGGTAAGIAGGAAAGGVGGAGFGGGLGQSAGNAISDNKTVGTVGKYVGGTMGGLGGIAGGAVTGGVTGLVGGAVRGGNLGHRVGSAIGRGLSSAGNAIKNIPQNLNHSFNAGKNMLNTNVSNPAVNQMSTPNNETPAVEDEQMSQLPLTDKHAMMLDIIKKASPQTLANFMQNYNSMSPAGQKNMATNPNVNPVAHQQLLSGMNWKEMPMINKAKALLTPNHPQNLTNRGVRLGTGIARSLAGDNPANVAANFKQITAPQPNRAMLQ
jgi:hypothetical protein